MLLHADEFRITNFHGQIATRHHHSVGGIDNGIQGVVVCHGFGAFDFGNDVTFAAGFLITAACFVYILRVAGKESARKSTSMSAAVMISARSFSVRARALRPPPLRFTPL